VLVPKPALNPRPQPGVISHCAGAYVSQGQQASASVGASQLTFLNPIACASGLGEALPFVSGTTPERGGKAAGGATDGTLPTSSFSNSMSLLIISSFTLALATFASRFDAAFRY